MNHGFSYLVHVEEVEQLQGLDELQAVGLKQQSSLQVIFYVKGRTSDSMRKGGMNRPRQVWEEIENSIKSKRTSDAEPCFRPW